MDEVSFIETSSVLDETDISMNISIGGADGGPDEDTLAPDSPVAESSTWADGGPDEDKLIPSSPVAETSGSKPVQPDLPPAETLGHSQHSPFAETSGSSSPKPRQSCDFCSYSTTSGEICIDINGPCIRTIKIRAVHVRESTVQSMTL